MKVYVVMKCDEFVGDFMQTLYAKIEDAYAEAERLQAQDLSAYFSYYVLDKEVL